jgi:hypothetical protein
MALFPQFGQTQEFPAGVKAGLSGSIRAIPTSLICEYSNSDLHFEHRRIHLAINTVPGREGWLIAFYIAVKRINNLPRLKHFSF